MSRWCCTSRSLCASISESSVVGEELEDDEAAEENDVDANEDEQLEELDEDAAAAKDARPEQSSSSSPPSVIPPSCIRARRPCTSSIARKLSCSCRSCWYWALAVLRTPMIAPSPRVRRTTSYVSRKGHDSRDADRKERKAGGSEEGEGREVQNVPTRTQALPWEHRVSRARVLRRAALSAPRHPLLFLCVVWCEKFRHVVDRGRCGRPAR